VKINLIDFSLLFIYHHIFIFQVQFTNATGEDESTDAGAIKLEFFEMLMKQFDNRLMEGPPGQRVPRKADPFLFTIFGLFLGHSLLHKGPGYYSFQPWIYDVLLGKDNEDDLIKLASKSLIPINSASINVVEFVDQLDNVQDESSLGILVDSNIQLVNCSQWDPTCAVTMKNKSFLGSELVYNELIRKRLHTLKGLSDGLKMIGFLKYMVNFPDLCKPVMVHMGNRILNKEQLIDLLQLDESEGFEQKQSFTFFQTFIDSNPEILSKIFRFATGLSEIIPWEKKKIAMKFLPDDESKIYPEAMACFNILYLPTVHSTQEAFSRHFSKALDIEGTGFGASF